MERNTDTDSFHTVVHRSEHKEFQNPVAVVSGKRLKKRDKRREKTKEGKSLKKEKTK